MSDEAHGPGLIDTNVVIHLAALDDAHLSSEMVISAVTLAELSAGPTTPTTQPSGPGA